MTWNRRSAPRVGEVDVLAALAGGGSERGSVVRLAEPPEVEERYVDNL